MQRPDLRHTAQGAQEAVVAGLSAQGAVDAGLAAQEPVEGKLSAQGHVEGGLSAEEAAGVVLEGLPPSHCKYDHQILSYIPLHQEIVDHCLGLLESWPNPVDCKLVVVENCSRQKQT